MEKLLKYDKQKNKDREQLFWIYTNAILNKTLDEIKISNPNVIIVDPTKELYKYEKKINFLDDGNHLNNNGHKVVGNEIFNSIIKYLRH